MRTPCLSLALSALLLGACVGSLREDAPPGVYDFGLSAREGAQNGAVDLTRMALDVRAASWLEGLGIDYRLAYDDPLRRSQYTGSRWAAPPARLLAQQLRQRLGFVAIDSIAADCVLRVELQEFAQVFTTPRESLGVLRGQASLIDGKRRLIGGHAFAIEHPASGPDAAGGVQALAQASEELGERLAAWLEGIERSGGLKDCRPR